jgi:hypothetical protein
MMAMAMAMARPVEVYMVGKRDSYTVVAQLSPEFTARLVDCWQELEQQGAGARWKFNVPFKALAVDIFAKGANMDERLSTVSENQDAHIGESPALWHRARSADSGIGWSAVNLNLRRIWTTLQDRCHGAINRFIRHRL